MAETTNMLRIKQTRSKIGYAQDQRDTLRSLGLRRINDVVVHPDSPSVRGMIHKVQHLVTFEVIPAEEI